MAELAELKLPVFLPGNNRDWIRVDGVARISDDGQILVTVKPENAVRLVELAKNDILVQLSFDYRMDQAVIDRINTQNQVKNDG